MNGAARPVLSIGVCPDGWEVACQRTDAVAVGRAELHVVVSLGGFALMFSNVAAPNMNACAERFVRTIRDECLSRVIFFDEAMLRRALAEFVAHYHAERPHQGIENVVPKPAPTAM